MSFDSLSISTCTIQLKTETQDSYGQMIESWADAVTDVSCRIDGAGGGLVGTPREVYERATHIFFMKVQAGVTLNSKDHRLIVGSDTYAILLVDEIYDSIGVHHLEVITEKIA